MTNYICSKMIGEEFKLLTIWETNIENFTVDLRIDNFTFSKANEEKKAKAFFFSIIEQLIIGKVSRETLEKIKQSDLRTLSFAFAKANDFEDLYTPKEDKPFYNSFRNALRVKRSNDLEQRWQDAVERWKTGFMGELDVALEEYKRALGPKTFHFAQAAAKLGWFFSPNIVPKIELKNLEIPLANEILKIVSRKLTGPKIKKIAENWFNLEYFSQRRKIIESVIRAYSRNDLELAIYGLIPQTEGVVWDFLVLTNPAESEMEDLIKFQNRKFVTVESVMRTIISRITGNNEIPFYKWVKFSAYDDTDHDLNRHAIEHGISMNFGTKENFLKLFCFFDFLHFILSNVKNVLKTETKRTEARRMSSITGNVKKILQELPKGVKLVAAAKTRTVDEINEAVRAGVEIIGENYVQEAEKVFRGVEEKVEWHFIGHLQKNKINKVIRIFDMVETIDSFELAKELDKRCARIGRIMPVLIEVNSGREPQKSGVMPEDVERMAREMSILRNIRILGLMTMGPQVEDPEKLRSYFKITREIFEQIKVVNIPNVEMKYLSMGMSDSYKIAIEEGANIVRIGTKLFGERVYEK